jgi:hypothetical protein
MPTITTIIKSLLGKQDVSWDVDGIGAVQVVPRSDGSFRQVNKINASHLPITDTVRGKKGADNVTITTTDVDATLSHILDQLVQIGIPDGTILRFNAGTLEIQDGKITKAQMAIRSVDSDQIVNGAIDSVAFAPGAVDQAAIGTGAVGTDELAANAVTTAKIVSNAVTNDKILDDTIKAVKFDDPHAGLIAEIGSLSSSSTTATFAHTTGVSGLLAGTDFVMIQMRQAGTSQTAVKTASITGTQQITAVTDAALSGGTVIFDYVIYSPVSV